MCVPVCLCVCARTYVLMYMRIGVADDRDEIAVCSADSYDVLSLESLRRMMLFSTVDELVQYIAANKVRVF